MFDFVISVFISFIVNLKIVPYLDILKNYYEQIGQDFTNQYNILLAVSYLTVGIIAYTIIRIIKYFLTKGEY